MRLPRLGVTLPQFHHDPAPALAAFEHAYRLGYHGVFLFDHLWPLGGDRTRPALECWTLLGALAGHAGRLAPSPAGPARGIRLGTLVTRAGLRAPALLARMAATAGQAAGQPLIVGVGAGDAANRLENDAFGLPYGRAGERAAAVAGTAQALRGRLAGDPPPEVWVGGASARLRAVAAGFADAWNAWGATPEELAAGLREVRKLAEAAGRDPGSVTATWGGQVLLGAGRADVAGRLRRWGEGRDPDEVRRVVAGDPGTVTAHLQALAEAGATWCVVGFVGGDASEMREALARSGGLLPRD